MLRGTSYFPLLRLLRLRSSSLETLSGSLHNVLFSPACLLSGVHEQLEQVLAITEGSSLTVENKTHQLISYYDEWNAQERTQFLRVLASDYSVDGDQLRTLAGLLASSMDAAATQRLQERLRKTLVPRYQQLFTQISRQERGVKFLVDLRADILNLLQSKGFNVEGPQLQILSNCLRDLLALWFSVGFLQLERITWQSPCDMVQKISDYEAVHPMRNWIDLKRRVGLYRRCFVFTHASMPREPVVVLHTALTQGISGNIKAIVNKNVDENDGSRENPTKIDTVIFYSITSPLKGLQGVELGNYMIKSVVRELQLEFPLIQQFSSLSPIPGFKDWLVTELNKATHTVEVGGCCNSPLFLENELSALQAALFCPLSCIFEAVKKTLQNNQWLQNQLLNDALRSALMRLCARYLYLEKRRGFALNPVANFHLRNGATMWRLNWLADTSARGLASSCGIMVNYRYFLEKCEFNSKGYMEKAHFIEASAQVLEWVHLTQATTNLTD